MQIIINIYNYKSSNFIKKKCAFALEAIRQKTNRWKRGFYYIVKGANIPIVIGYLNYEKKTMGTGGLFYSSDAIEADMIKIKSFYKDKVAKYPEYFSCDPVA